MLARAISLRLIQQSIDERHRGDFIPLKQIKTHVGEAMPDLSLDLKYLRYALAAAQHQSFRRAASALNISQSTLVRRVQLLEHRIGFRIFDRGPSGVRLTSAGELFLEEASVGMHQLSHAIELASSVRRGERGEIQVGVLLSLAAGPLHIALREFHRRYPHIRVSFHEGTAEQDLARVTTGELDISFIAGEPKLAGQKALRVWSESVHVALPADHRLADHHELHWSDLKEETFLVTRQGAGPEVRDYLVRKLSAPGFRPKIDVHDVSRQSLLNVVAMGYGITLASSSIIGGTADGIRFRPICGDPELLPWTAIWSPGNSNPALQYLLRIVNEVSSGKTPKRHANGIRRFIAFAVCFNAFQHSWIDAMGQLLEAIL